MKIVTIPQLKQFVKAQKNDRKIIMWQGKADSEIGCLLTHYCKSKRIKFDNCCFIWAWRDGKHVLQVQGEDGKYALINQRRILFKRDFIASFDGTYGELKKLLVD